MTRIVERITRSGFHALLPLTDGSHLGVLRGWLLKLDVGSSSFRRAFRIPRGSRPLNICAMPDGRLFWGEYFTNPERRTVHIYGSGDGGESWHPAYSFPAGSIRHVHGIVYDPHRDGCWVLTGDLDHESRIMFSREPFSDLETVFGGSQQVRCVSLIPRKNDIIAGSDTASEENYIQKLDPESGTMEKVQRVPGSVFYSAIVGEYVVLSTAVEPSEVNSTHYASLWMSRDGATWRELYRGQKDAWTIPALPGLPSRFAGPRLFQHGVFVLPQGRNSNAEIYAYGQAIVGDDGNCLCWHSEELKRASGQ